MAEGGGNLKGSRSVEDIKSRKPGKLSADLLGKFESDPTLSRPDSCPSVNTSTHLSAENLVLRTGSEESTVLHRDVKPTKGNVRISLPPDEEYPGHNLSSNEDEILSDSEATEDKQGKKKSRWKWHPFKKMRRLFSRKKNSNRAKSYEDVQVASYKPTAVLPVEDEDDSLVTRTKSEPSLAQFSRRPVVDSSQLSLDRLVQRTQSVPTRQNVLMHELKQKQRGSHEEIAEVPLTPPMSPEDKETKTVSLPALNWSLINSDGGSEAAVSFDSLPNASSLEGLQAAHDKIKAAPKHRRPPARARARTSSTHVTKELPPKRPHKRSKTVPTGLIGKIEETPKAAGDTKRNSDIVSRTIFENAEMGEAEDGATNESEKESLPDSRGKSLEAREEKAAADEALAQIRARASDILAKVTNSPNLTEGKVVSDEDVTVEEKPKDSGEGLRGESVEASGNTKKEVILKQSSEKKDEETDRAEPANGTVVLKDEIKKREKDKEVAAKCVSNDTAPKIEEKVKSVESTSITTTEGDIHHPGAGETPQRGGVGTKDAPVTAPKTTKHAAEPAETADKPDWVALAHKKSKRVSQLIERSDTNTVEESTQENAVSKETGTTKVICGKMKKLEKPKVSPFKPVIMNKPQKPVPAQAKTQLKRLPLNRSYSAGKPSITESRKATTQNSFRGFQCDKCIVCGTNVYQTERCSFDNSVLHRHCIKCTVCNRLLTVGNFVVSESKIYCKPHGQAVPVSM